MGLVLRVNKQDNYKIEWISESMLQFTGNICGQYFCDIFGIDLNDYFIKEENQFKSPIYLDFHDYKFVLNISETGFNSLYVINFSQRTTLSVTKENIFNINIIGQAFDKVGSIVIVFDDSGTVLFCNDAAVSKISCSGEKLAGKHISSVINKSVSELIQNISGENSNNTFLTMFKSPCDKDSNLYFQTLVSKLKYLGSEVYVIIGIDVTSEAKLKKNLEKTETIFEKVFQCNPAAVGISDINTSRFVRVNDTFIKETGYSREEAIGKTAYELGLLPLESRDVLREHIYNNKMCEIDVTHKNGEVYTGLFSGDILELDDKKYFVVSMLNIDERVKALKSLENTLDKMEAIINTIPGMINIVDKDYNIMNASENLVKGFGYNSFDKICGRKCYEVYKGRKEPCLECSVGEAFDKDKIVTRISTVQESETLQQTLKIYSAPVKDKSGNIIGAVEAAMDVTDIVKAEAQLREQQGYIKSILDFQANIIIVTDGKRMKNCNKSFLEYFNYDSLDDFLAEHDCICDFFLEKDGYISESSEENWLNKVHENHASGIDSKVVMKTRESGEERIYLVEHRRFPLSNEEYIVAFTDITDMEMYQLLLKDTNTALDAMVEKRTAELEVAVSKFQEAQKIAKIGSWEIDIETKRMSFSKEAYSIFEITENTDNLKMDVLIGKIAENKIDEFSRMIEKVAGTNRKFNLDTDLFVKSNQKKFVNIIGQGIASGNLNKKIVRGTVHDVTEQKMIERALKDSEKLINAVFEAASIGLCLLDEKGFFVTVNNKFCEITGYTEYELIGERFTFVLERGIAEEELIKLRDGREPVGPELNFINKAGKQINTFVSTNKVKINDDKTFYVFAAADITDLKIIEEKQRRQEKMLIQQSKMAAMGEMIGAIAHQWKQPLNSIGLIAQLLEEDFLYGELDEDNLSKSIKDIMEQVGFMDSTIDSFRNFFKPAREKQFFNAFASIEEVVGLLTSQFKNYDIVIELNCRTGSNKDCTVMGYPNEFKQVILNLLSNAKDAILKKWEDRGKELYEKGTVFIDSYCADKIIKFEFTDEGCGIPQDAADKIFDAYFTTKGEKGTGIGLHMAKTIVEDKMDGQISVEPVENGTRFTIAIPYSKQF